VSLSAGKMHNMQLAMQDCMTFITGLGAVLVYDWEVCHLYTCCAGFLTFITGLGAVS
jgi:hypothetical protein